MKSGYDQFFQKAKENNRASGISATKAPKIQLKSKKQMVQKRKKSYTNITLFSAFCFLVTLCAYLNEDELGKYGQMIEVNFLGSAQAENTSQPEQAPSKGQAKPETSPEGEVAKDEKTSGATELDSENMDPLAKLKERSSQLDLKEQELKRYEEELAKQKEEIEKKLADLQSARDNIAAGLNEKVVLDEKKIESLVQLYSSMKPQSSAKIFETMDEDLVVELLTKMKKKSAAEILNSMKAEKAKLISEKFAGIKRDLASTNTAPTDGAKNETQKGETKGP